MKLDDVELKDVKKVIDKRQLDSVRFIKMNVVNKTELAKELGISRNAVYDKIKHSSFNLDELIVIEDIIRAIHSFMVEDEQRIQEEMAIV